MGCAARVARMGRRRHAGRGGRSRGRTTRTAAEPSPARSGGGCRIRRGQPGHGGRPGALRRTTGCSACRMRVPRRASRTMFFRASPTGMSPPDLQPTASLAPVPGARAGAPRRPGAAHPLPAGLAHRPLQLPLHLLLAGGGGAAGRAPLPRRAGPALPRLRGAGGAPDPAHRRRADPAPGGGGDRRRRRRHARGSRRWRSPPTATGWPSWPSRCGGPASAPLNVSLDTLRPERLAGVSGRGARLDRILAGLDAAAGQVPLAQGQHGGAARRERGRAGRAGAPRLGPRRPAPLHRADALRRRRRRCRWPRCGGCWRSRGSSSRPTAGAAGARPVTCAPGAGGPGGARRLHRRHDRELLRGVQPGPGGGRRRLPGLPRRRGARATCAPCSAPGRPTRRWRRPSAAPCSARPRATRWSRPGTGWCCCRCGGLAADLRGGGAGAPPGEHGKPGPPPVVDRPPGP